MVYLLALIEGTQEGLLFLFQLALIIFPLMIILTFFEELHVIDYLTRLLQPLSRPLTLSPQAIFPLLVGLIFGLSYGAGVIIKYTKEGSLSQRDMTLVGIFLAICHAIFEDTLFFVALGANIFWVFLFRLFLAVVIVSILGHTLMVKRE